MTGLNFEGTEKQMVLISSHEQLGSHQRIYSDLVNQDKFKVGSTLQTDYIH